METTRVSRVTVRTMPLGELRARVEEAEKLLRVAKQLARDELGDPQQCSRVRDRIGSIVSEVQSMFPGLGEPDTEAAEADRLVEEELGVVERADAVDGTDAAEGLGDDENVSEGGAEEEEGEDVEDEEWELDCDKLRAALANDELMSQIPEADRPRFRAMAERLLDVHERGELYTRILVGFEELAEVTREGAEAVQRQLATMLTFGGKAALADLATLGDMTGSADADASAIAAMLATPPKYKA